MKNTKEYLAQLFDSETPIFVRVFSSLSPDKLDWKPDPKSLSALERASMMARESSDFAYILRDGVLKYDPMAKSSWTTPAEIAAAFQEGMASAKTALAAMSDVDWEADAVMMMDGKEVWKTKRGEMGLGLMLDLIHHRGQLSTYIRPMGGKVPSIYGPSADVSE